jgi:hypothetical protein
VTGWGALHPRYLENRHDFYCPRDPGRGPAWRFRCSDWNADRSEVQCSYGYRGRQGLVEKPEDGLTLSLLERFPRKVLGCDFYEPFFAPRGSTMPDTSTSCDATGRWNGTTRSSA